MQRDYTAQLKKHERSAQRGTAERQEGGARRRVRGCERLRECCGSKREGTTRTGKSKREDGEAGRGEKGEREKLEAKGKKPEVDQPDRPEEWNRLVGENEKLEQDRAKVLRMKQAEAAQGTTNR
jgi:hypothetical protein